MHRLSRLLVLCTLSLGLTTTTGCKRTQSSSDTSPGATSSSDGDGPSRPKRVRRKPGLPRPLRLPTRSPILLHVQMPADAIAGLRSYAPQLRAGNGLLQDAVAQMPGSGELEQRLAAAVDLERPWDVVSVDGELIVHVSILPVHVKPIATLLADKPPVGRFGGVDLQRGAAPGPKFAWLDQETKTLTLASSERGLATGRHLAREYGKVPLRVELTGADVRKYVPQFALESLEVTGAGLHEFEIDAKGVPPEVLAQFDSLQPGALTGLLDSPRIAAGASSKYAHYERDVRKILGDVKRQVDRQSFLVKGTLQDLSRRLGATMRSWNGRIMVGVGPKNHVLIGLGADDPKKMGGALFHLMTGVIDNLELARSIGVSVPKIRLKRNRNEAAGSNISAIAIADARKYLPPEAHGLLADKGDLRIAVAFPSRTGAALVVAGPNSPEVLAAWLEDIADATPGDESTKDFIAATAAVSPRQVQPLIEGGAVDLRALLGLQASKEPTTLRLVRTGDRLTAEVSGPKIARKAHHIGMPGRRAAAGKPPARVAPSAGKPIR